MILKDLVGFGSVGGPPGGRVGSICWKHPSVGIAACVVKFRRASWRILGVWFASGAFAFWAVDWFLASRALLLEMSRAVDWFLDFGLCFVA